jgi:hypothetical protein
MVKDIVEQFVADDEGGEGHLEAEEQREAGREGGRE